MEVLDSALTLSDDAIQALQVSDTLDCGKIFWLLYFKMHIEPFVDTPSS